MNIKVNKSDLLQVLTTAIKAVPTKTATPILENFLLNVENGSLSVTASDANITVIAKCEAEGEGKACIPAKTLRELVGTLPDGEVTVETDDTTATISWGKGHSTIPVFKIEDYPEIKAPEGEGFCIGSEALKSALKHTLPHTATDELRPQLCGVYFNPTDTGLDLVASDSHTMSVYPIEGEGKPNAPFVLPTNAATLVRDLGCDVTVTSDGSMLRFDAENLSIQTKQIIGKFPNYKGVIPEANPNAFTFPVAMLMDSIRRVSICANKASNYIKFTLDTLAGVIIEAQDLGFGCAAKEELDYGSYQGEKLEIGLRADLILKTLNGLDAEKAMMRFADARRAVLVEGEGDPSKAIVMPISVK